MDGQGAGPQNCKEWQLEPKLQFLQGTRHPEEREQTFSELLHPLHIMPNMFQ